MRRYLSCLLVALAVVAVAPAADPDLARQAKAILQTHCYECHGKDGVFEGGFNHVLDAGKLVARRKVVAGKADQSPLLARMVKGTMPPPDHQPRPSLADVATLRKWIDDGAPSWDDQPAKARTLITAAEQQRQMLDDLAPIDRRARRFIRYFSIAHLYNHGLSDDELQTYRNALSKLLNSLSWHPRVSVPVAVDPAKTLLRIDLRHYLWDANTWNRLLVDYPYGVLDDSVTARAVMVGTATKMPIVRGDWFIATASRAPLYYELLQMPTTAAELERQLRIDAAANIQQERVVRLGFNGSGVSKNNRILERHDSVHGAYWRTYDFDAVPQNLAERGALLPDRRNIFAYPLGPGLGDAGFLHAGGEVIFNLPNGLHAFMLVNAVGARVDKGAAQIVSDPRRPDRAVEAGVSCMSCHLTGINPKTDQVRDHTAKNPKAFSRVDAEIIRALYAPVDRANRLMADDAERYRSAVTAAGAKPTKTEPVSTLTLRYEADLDLLSAATEAGFTPDDFLTRIRATESLMRNLGALQVAGGTISRQVFLQTFGDLVRDLQLGTLFTANNTGGNLPDNTGELDPLEAPGGTVNHAAIFRDGRLALLASADRSLRLFDIEAGRDVRRFVGHSASVWCVALSPDETRAVSGSMDGTMRLWDIASGQELKRFDGHLTLVAAVAFASDGRRALSGGYDGSVVLWDTATGQELRRWDGLARYVHAIAMTSDGKRAAVAADQMVVLLDLAANRAPATLTGFTAAVTSAAFSPDQRQLVAGSDDGTARIWNLSGAAPIPLHTLTGHVGPIRDVAFSPSGKAILTAGADRSVRLWDAAASKLLARFDRHAQTLVRASFLLGGRQTLSISRDGVTRPWPLTKFLDRVVAADAKSPPATMAASPSPVWKPVAVIPIGGTIGNLALSPNGKWLYLIDRSNGRLVQINTATGKESAEWPVPDPAATFALKPDGKAIFTFAATKSVQSSSKYQTTTIFEIDPISLAVRRRFDIDAQPHDMVATDQGLLFLTGAAGGWSELLAVDVKAGSIVGRWGGIWTRSLVQQTASPPRLYVATQGVTPGKIEIFPIPVELSVKPASRAAVTDDPIGGPFRITPDGRFLLSQTGTLLRLSDDKNDDLRPAGKLPPHLASAIDPALGVALLLEENGTTLRRYSYPEWQWRGSYELPSLNHGLAFDSATNRVFVATIDPRSLRDRPRAKGHGEVRVYQVPE